MDASSSEDAGWQLAEIDRQRRALADRIRIPGWYQVAYAAALLCYLLPHLLPGDDTAGNRPLFSFVSTISFLVVSALLETVVRRTAGAKIQVASMWRSPSARGVFVVRLLIFVGVITWGVALSTSAQAAVLASVLATAGILYTDYWVLAAIRRDIIAGKAVPQ